MIIRIVKLPVQPEKVKEFLSHFEQAKEKIRSFDGCLHLQLLNDLNPPFEFFTLSHWKSEEHLKNYQQSELFKETWARVKPLFNGKPEAWSTSKLITI
ncbi:MAG: antibiotic biosynthesis monooxygenase [Bacteroidia bacterium]|nr:antibiotic biosynthesis monooxygenase [Bacteroidia bacterium]MCZ2277687.1 antibiotic biosynthesis monooxygenase [Bacteroidia bacterium]